LCKGEEAKDVSLQSWYMELKNKTNLQKFSQCGSSFVADFIKLEIKSIDVCVLACLKSLTQQENIMVGDFGMLKIVEVATKA
jgi:hypothetical protein